MTCEDTQDETTLEVDMDEIEGRQYLASKPLFLTETFLHEHVWAVLETFEGLPAQRLKEVFRQHPKKLKVGTLCSGSDSVMDVLEAFPCLKFGGPTCHTHHTSMYVLYTLHVTSVF